MTVKQAALERLGDPSEELAAIAELGDGWALDALLSQVEAKPDYADLRYELARRYALAGRLPEALEELDHALAVNGGYADALRLKTRILADRGDLRAALTTCQRLNASSPTSESRLAEGVLLARLGDHVGAVAAAHQSLELSRSNAEAHMLLGEQYLRLDELGLAQRHFELASRLRPDADACYLAALTSLKLGDRDSASAGLQRALEVEPRHYNAAVRMAALKVDEGDYLGAHRLLSALIEHYPSYPDLHYGLARVCVLMARNAEAVRLMQTALDLNPRYAEARREMAALCAADKGAEAAEHAARGLEVDPDDEEAAINLGRIYSKNGDPERAIAVLERAVERFPDSWRILRTLGILNLQEKRYPKARLALRAAAQVHPGLESTDRSLRIVFRDETLFEEERSRLEAEYSGETESPAFQHRLGRLYLEFGKEAAAVQAIRRSFDAGHAPIENGVLLSILYANRSDYATAGRWLSSPSPDGLARQVRTLLLGLFEANLGEYERSTRLYQQVMTESPLLFHALGGLGVCFREREEVEDMLDDYLDYARYNDRGAALMCRLGEAYAAKGMLIESRRQYDYAAILDHSDGEAFHALGILALFHLDLDESARLLNLAAERKPDWALPHLALALVEHERGARLRAMISLQRYNFLEAEECWRELAERWNAELNEGDEAESVQADRRSEERVAR
jgi:tetratricopeptide (TPR) repeat protein